MLTSSNVIKSSKMSSKIAIDTMSLSTKSQGINQPPLQHLPIEITKEIFGDDLIKEIIYFLGKMNKNKLFSGKENLQISSRMTSHEL